MPQDDGAEGRSEERFKRETQNWGKGGKDLMRSRGLMRRGGGILCKKWMGDC